MATEALFYYTASSNTEIVYFLNIYMYKITVNAVICSFEEE